MPFTIRKRGDKFIVTKKDGTKTFGSHNTRQQAVKQIGAIESSERRRRAK